MKEEIVIIDNLKMCCGCSAVALLGEDIIHSDGCKYSKLSQFGFLKEQK